MPLQHYRSAVGILADLIATEVALNLCADKAPIRQG